MSETPDTSKCTTDNTYNVPKPTVRKDESTLKPESESTCISDNSSERYEKQHKGEQLNETKGRKNQNEQFKETEITVCAGRWKLSRARKRRKKSSMHRKSKSTPTTRRVARNIQRSNSYETTLPQPRSGILPPYAVPARLVHPCCVGAPVPQLEVLHSISSDTSQPPTGATVTPSEWNQQSNVPSSWHTGTHQNVVHESTTANPVVHVTAEPNGYSPASASADYSTVAPASSTAWKKTSGCTTSAPTNFNFGQYRDGDGLSGWDENREYSAVPTHSNNESAPARKPAGAIPVKTVKTASNRTKPSTHKNNVHQKKQVHGRSSSATTGSRRTFSRKEISDATQSLKEIMRQATARKKICDAVKSLKEIMRQAGVPAIPDNQIIQAAVNYMKLLIATLKSAKNQFAELAERFAKVANCPVPVLQPLDGLPSPLPMPSPSPNSTSDSESCNNFAFSGEEGSPRPVQLPLHPRPVMPAHQARRRRRRRQPQQQQTVPVHATSNSFAEEVRDRIHSRHGSVGATDFAKLSMDKDTQHSDLGMMRDNSFEVPEDTQHSDLQVVGMRLDTKMMRDNSFEVDDRIHSRHGSVGATDFAKLSMDQDTQHSNLQVVGMRLDTKMIRDNSFEGMRLGTKMMRDNSFEVDDRIHSRHGSAGATDKDTQHSDLGMTLGTKMMRDNSFEVRDRIHVDVDFLDPAIDADPGLLQSLDDLRSPQKDTLFGTPPPSPRSPRSPRVMMSPASMCTSPTSDLLHNF